MKRKDFLKKGLLGTAIFSSSSAFAGLVSNKVDELEKLEVVGFNHIPNTESNVETNAVLHRAHTRGHANHGWLDTYHTFSFANYHNPERMHFGVLRVLNDDTVDAGRGFGTHPHDNMEIISIPLEGDLEHKDSMGNISVIRNGEVQVMSAGTGITHSEYNRNKNKQVRFLQIWLFPNKKNVTPRYDQIKLTEDDRCNKFQQILSPSSNDEGVWIHQEAWFHLGKFDQGIKQPYQLKNTKNGVYAFVINGRFQIGNLELGRRDGLGLWDLKDMEVKSLEDQSEILLMEVPMTLS